MAQRMIVNVEDVLAAIDERRRINHGPLKEIAWHYKGQEIPITEALIEEWGFTGLINTDFVDRVIRDCLPEGEVTMRRISCGIVCTRVSAYDVIEVLMQFKCKFQQWEFPGGKLDGVETASECAQRELLEETGLETEQLYQEQYIDHRDEFGCVMFHAPLHLMKQTTPKLMEPHKHSALDWFPIGQLPTPMTDDSTASVEEGILESVRKYYGSVYATKR